MNTQDILRKILGQQTAARLIDLALDSALHRAGVITAMVEAVDALATDARADVERLAGEIDALRPDAERLGQLANDARRQWNDETDPDRQPIAQAEAQVAERKSSDATRTIGGLQIQHNAASERLARLDNLASQLQALEPPTDADVQRIVNAAIERRTARAG